MGVQRQMWTGQVLQYLTSADNDSFLQGIQDFSSLVSSVGNEAQAIHMVDFGVLPDVLINNTTYPIATQNLADGDVIIQLDKFQTKSTPITDDELYALTYNKIQLTKDRHALAIQIQKVMKAIHSFGPSGDTASMPVLLTTGPDDGTGRKRLTWKDVRRLKVACDKLQIPAVGRRLVLCADHLNDLIEDTTNQYFKDQYYNRDSGKVYSQLGFEIYDYIANPYYRPSTGAKLSFGATPLATDFQASVMYSLARVVKATGWVKMYFTPAEIDTEYQQNRVNFRHNFIAMPTKEEARGAIVSDIAL